MFKPTLELPDGDVKGNVDAELVLHTMVHINDFDKTLIVTGDGDFHCLIEYLLDQKKAPCFYGAKPQKVLWAFETKRFSSVYQICC